MTTDGKHWTREPRLLTSPLPSFILSLHSETTGRFSTYSVIMRVTGLRAYPRPTAAPTMPPGIVELMEGLAKDVLRNNPENVYEFCAGHMQKLLEIRDGAPPKTQLSLDEKIKKARDKIQRRLKKNRVQEKVQLEPANATHDNTHDTDPVTEILAKNSDTSMPPVEHEEWVIADVVNVFHEPDMSKTETDSSQEGSLYKDRKLEGSMVNTVKTLLNDESKNATQEGIKESHTRTQEVLADISAAHQTMESQDTGNNIGMDSSAKSNQLLTGESAIEVKEEIKLNEDMASNTPQNVETNNQKSTIGIPKSDVVLQVSDETKNLTITCDENTESAPEMALSHDSASGSKESIKPYNLNINDNTTVEVKETVEPDTINVKAIKEDQIFTEEIALISNNKENLNVNDNTMTEITETVETAAIDGKAIKDDHFFTEEIALISNNKEILNVNDTTTTEVKEIVETEIIDGKAVNEGIIQHLTAEIPLISNNKDSETFRSHNLPAEKSEDPSQSDKTIMLAGDNNQAGDINSDVELINDGKIVTDTEKNHNETYNKKVDLKNPETIKKHDETIPVSSLDKTDTEDNLLNYSQPELAKIETLDQIVEGNNQPTNPESNLESPDKIIMSENLEHLERSKCHDDIQHGLNDVDLSKIDKDVFDNFDKLLEQEPQSSSELVIEKNDIIPDSTPVMNKKEYTTCEDDEPAENPAAMDLETAAITIQKVFRTFLFSKSRASTLEDTVAENYLKDNLEDIVKKDEPEFIMSTANLNKERRTLGISRMDTVLQTVNEEKSLSLSTDDSSTLSSAATTIQAHVRGFLVRNRLASYKTASGSSLVNSDGPSTISLDGDTNEPKKTILNIHIVPERGQFMSRDESMLTSIDLPLDNSPPSSVNLHPLGYDKSEPRKQLKREDAIQSVSPPSNNSGKLSEDVDFMKDPLNEKESDTVTIISTNNDKQQDGDAESCDTTLTISSTADTVIDAELYSTREVLSTPEHNPEAGYQEAVSHLTSNNEDLLSTEHQSEASNKDAVTNLSSDEMDVVTPFLNTSEKTVLPQGTEIDDKPKLVHSGEFHDIVVQTQVKRSESSVVRGE